MTYRKFKADYLFTGNGLAVDDSVLITTTDGMVQDIVPETQAGADIGYYPGLLSPGFINCHCHLELSHMQGVIPEHTGLVDFLTTVIRQRNQPETASLSITEAIARAEQTMFDNGIVAVGDICNTVDTLAQKRAGLLRYRNFIETLGFVEHGATMRFNGSKLVLDQFEAVFPGMNTLVPHAPYSVSPALFRLIAGHGTGQLLTIHNQETEEENTFLLTGKGDFLRLYEALGVDISAFTGTGKRSMESALQYFNRDQSMILVHNVVTQEQDLEAARGILGPGLFFCLCPNANQYISGRLPDVATLVRSGCRIVVGTDSLASNHELNILGELKTLQSALPGLSTTTLLRWATLNGAQALRFQDKLGSFERGRTPGILLLEGMDGTWLKPDTTVRRLL